MKTVATTLKASIYFDLVLGKNQIEIVVSKGVSRCFCWKPSSVGEARDAVLDESITSDLYDRR